MKYVIIGGAGHIAKPVTEKLLEAGHIVTVIGRNEANLKELIDEGAEAAIGSVEDVEFLKKTFVDADAVYTMTPPNYATENVKGFIAQIGKNYATALKSSDVRYVVNLSSIGAHLPEGAGPISGMYHTEAALNSLKHIHIKHLRPAYFYQNLLANIGMIKHMGIIGANFKQAEHAFPIVETADIAAVAAEELLNLDFSGHSFRYIASDEISTDDIASVIGNAIGKPDLKWVTFSDEQALEGMLQAGLPKDIAANYTEMNNAINSGKVAEDYWLHRPKLGNTKLTDFAKTFAAVYNSN
jgi:uncharacterized protein YbjT (DUF2867 family)